MRFKFKDDINNPSIHYLPKLKDSILDELVIIFFNDFLSHSK